MKFLLAGVDLAWGERRPDGVCLAGADAHGMQIASISTSKGDEELIALLDSHFANAHVAIIAMDAPVVCPNDAGARPVDILAQRLFRRQHAGPHPCNRRLCARPQRIAQTLQSLGFTPAWKWSDDCRKILIEVFPHPALVRWGNLEKTIKYKRGRVAVRRQEFRVLTRLLRHLLHGLFADVRFGEPVEELLEATWTKEVEDKLDACICTLIAWQHLRSQGTETEILGDLSSGFLVIPAEPTHSAPALLKSNLLT